MRGLTVGVHRGAVAVARVCPPSRSGINIGPGPVNLESGRSCRTTLPENYFRFAFMAKVAETWFRRENRTPETGAWVNVKSRVRISARKPAMPSIATMPANHDFDGCAFQMGFASDSYQSGCGNPCGAAFFSEHPSVFSKLRSPSSNVLGSRFVTTGGCGERVEGLPLPLLWASACRCFRWLLWRL